MATEDKAKEGYAAGFVDGLREGVRIASGGAIATSFDTASLRIRGAVLAIVTANDPIENGGGPPSLD